MSLEGLLDDGEKVVWKTKMRFVSDAVPGYNDMWLKGELIFTDRRLLWS